MALLWEGRHCSFFPLKGVCEFNDNRDKSLKGTVRIFENRQKKTFFAKNTLELIFITQTIDINTVAKKIRVLKFRGFSQMFFVLNLILSHFKYNNLCYHLRNEAN